MNNLSIEELKSLREAYYGMQYEKIVAVLDELIAIRELKGDKVPVAWTDAEELRDMTTDGCAYLFKVDPANPFTDPRRQIMLYDHPQKPVVLPEAYDDGHGNEWLPRGATIAAIEAAGGIVKDGE